MSYVTVFGAYKRDYKSAKAMQEDWEANKDFIETQSHRYINKNDAELQKVTGVIGRYKNLTLVCNLKGK